MRTSSEPRYSILGSLTTLSELHIIKLVANPGALAPFKVKVSHALLRRKSMESKKDRIEFQGSDSTVVVNVLGVTSPLVSSTLNR